MAGVFLFGLATLAAWSAWSATDPDALQLLPCPVHVMTGVICPGCGITRACLSLARGEFAGAWSYHPFAYLLVPLAIAIALFPRKTKQAWSRVPKIPRRLLLAVTLAACLALWIARLG